MPTYVISLKYSRGGSTDFVDYETKNPNLVGAKRDAKELAKQEREKTGLSVRVLRVESRAASDRRRERELGF